jgi:hypothetical protein
MHDDNSFTRGTPVRPNFVAPVRRRKVEAAPPEPQEMTLHPPVRLESVAASETDRAVAFNISTAGLAAIVGVGGLLLAVVGWKVPIFSLAALAIFFSLAALIWAGAWLFHNLASPDGIGLLGVLLQYRLLRHEQRSRLDRLDSMMDGERWHEQ